MEEATYPPGHRMGYVKRRDKLTPGLEGLMYTPFCTCGWKDIDPKTNMARWYRPKRHIKFAFLQHIKEVEKQLTLPFKEE